MTSGGRGPPNPAHALAPALGGACVVEVVTPPGARASFRSRLAPHTTQQTRWAATADGSASNDFRHSLHRPPSPKRAPSSRWIMNGRRA